MVNFCAVCGCCIGIDIVREHLEDTLRICDVSAYRDVYRDLQTWPFVAPKCTWLFVSTRTPEEAMPLQGRIQTIF